MQSFRHTYIQNDTSTVKSKSACDENYLTLWNKKYFDTQPIAGLWLNNAEY